MGLVFWAMAVLLHAILIILDIVFIVPTDWPTIFMGSLIFYIIAFFLSRRFSGGWNTNVRIYERRGSGHVIFYDKYRHRKMPEGEEYGELQKAKVRIKPVDYKFIDRDEKGKFTLTMVSPAKGEYHPIRFDPTTKQLIGTLDPYYVNWLTTENKRAVMKWQKQGLINAILQHLPLILLITVCTIMLVIYMDQLSKTLLPFYSTANNMAQAAQSMAEAVRILNQTGSLGT